MNKTCLAEKTSFLPPLRGGDQIVKLTGGLRRAESEFGAPMLDLDINVPNQAPTSGYLLAALGVEDLDNTLSIFNDTQL